MAKKTLPPALKANADRLKRGEPLHQGKKTTSTGKAKTAAQSQKPRIRSKQKKG